MEFTRLMDCGDGFRRADNGCVATDILAKTADYTIKALDTGKIFTNRGASGAVAFNLPAPKKGMWVGFQKAVNNQNMVVNTDVAATKIHNLTQGVTLTNSTTEYGYCEIFSDGTAWFVRNIRGTWAVS